MNNELKELFRLTIAQKDHEIAMLKARVVELEEELLNSRRQDLSATNQKHQLGVSGGSD